MSYDHSKKAGNLGDVWKHAVLVSIANHLSVGSTFRYVESHSGAPNHELRPGGEWRRGIGIILDQLDDECHPYLQHAKSLVANSNYHSGWMFFAAAMSPRVQTLSIHLHDISPDVAQHYRGSLRDLMPLNANGVFSRKDGYASLESIEADLVFLDPPFVPDDWGALARACRRLKRRGIAYLAWYPIFWPTKPAQLVNQTSQPGWEVMWREFGAKPCQNMKGCGMLVSDDLVPVIESARTELEIVARHMGSAGGISIHNPRGGPGCCVHRLKSQPSAAESTLTA